MNQETLKQLLTYNLETGSFTWNLYKRCVKKGSVAGSTAGSYLKIGINYKSYLAHRLAWLYVHGYIPDCIDHINGNKLDNRIKNLREATNEQNSKNSKKSSRNTSGVKGVSFDKQHNRWRAELFSNGKRVFFKYFKTLEDAAISIKEIRKLHHGEFARDL